MDRHHDRAGFPAREERGDVVVARRAQHCDPRLMQVDRTVEQRACESRRIRVELRIRPGPGPIDDGRPIAERPHARTEIVHCETSAGAASVRARNKATASKSVMDTLHPDSGTSVLMFAGRMPVGHRRLAR